MKQWLYVNIFKYRDVEVEVQRVKRLKETTKELSTVFWRTTQSILVEVDRETMKCTFPNGEN